jgi:hypothetical protein
MSHDEDLGKDPIIANTLGPGDRLTDAQAIRLYEVIGRLKGIRAGIDAGMTAEEADAQEWIVHVELLEPGPEPV